MRLARLDNILPSLSLNNNKIGIRRSSKGGNSEEVLYLPIFEIKIRNIYP